MLIKRLVVGLILLPIIITAIINGGWGFAILMALVLGMAAWEFVALFKTGGFQPAGLLVVVGAGGFTLVRYVWGTEQDAALITGFILLAMLVHELAFEKGRQESGSDFAVTLTGFLYIGLLGSYFVILRSLPEGEWWLLTALPAVWIADTGAYFVGTKYGKHKMTPRLSPNKSWEGYIGGIVLAVFFTSMLVNWYASKGWITSAYITPFSGAVVGLVMAVFTTLGDLGESMIKRQMGAKDSGTILPGHGGFFDRIDSMLWAAPIAYYVIVWFFL